MLRLLADENVDGAPLGGIIDDIVLLVECSSDGEWEGRVLYLPL